MVVLAASVVTKTGKRELLTIYPLQLITTKNSGADYKSWHSCMTDSHSKGPRWNWWHEIACIAKVTVHKRYFCGVTLLPIAGRIKSHCQRWRTCGEICQRLQLGRQRANWRTVSAMVARKSRERSTGPMLDCVFTRMRLYCIHDSLVPRLCQPLDNWGDNWSD